ncbi:MAG: hypothetical protein ACOCQ4_00835 [bacterium]
MNLTVVAQPFEPDGSMPPNTRNNYVYRGIPPKKFFGLIWQPKRRSLLVKESWDVVWFDFNFRQIGRLIQFFLKPNFMKRWVWRGLIFGSKKIKILNIPRKFFLKRSVNNLGYSFLWLKMFMKNLVFDQLVLIIQRLDGKILDKPFTVIIMKLDYFL